MMSIILQSWLKNQVQSGGHKHAAAAQVYVVETEAALGPAMYALVSSMHDTLIAVDLE